jgi:hypothetical protein
LGESNSFSLSFVSNGFCSDMIYINNYNEDDARIRAVLLYPIK